MRSLETGFHDKAGYLERMSHSLREKLRIADFINSSDPRILDVGCADGTVTRAIGQLFPGGHVTGIDLSDDFLAKAREDHSAGAPMFEKIFLWEVREQGRRFTTILFTSVLHEIYHYGEKLQSVQNALTNSYAMLEPGGADYHSRYDTSRINARAIRTREPYHCKNSLESRPATTRHRF